MGVNYELRKFIPTPGQSASDGQTRGAGDGPPPSRANYARNPRVNERKNVAALIMMSSTRKNETAADAIFNRGSPHDGSFAKNVFPWPVGSDGYDNAIRSSGISDRRRLLPRGGSGDNNYVSSRKVRVTHPLVFASARATRATPCHREQHFHNVICEIHLH
jgi:hypothetical protein